MDDFELLQAYVHQRDEDAFTEVVNRHCNLVYSAAMRQTLDPQIAAEITQSVFIILARKAGTIRRDAVLPGWLLSTTHYTAANFRRRELSRHHLEQRAMENLYQTETESAWNEIGPRLDEALTALAERDRDLVALRFFAQKSYKDIGTALSLSEDGARKRVTRAMERLRTILGKQGKLLAPGIVAAAISARAVQAAPPGLAKAVATLSLANASVAIGSLSLAIQATLRGLTFVRWKAIAARTTPVALAGALVLLALNQVVNRRQNISAPVTTMTSNAGSPVSEVTNKPIPGFRAAGVKPAGDSALLFRVIDSESQRPVRDARLILTSVTDFPNRSTNVFITDQRGESLVLLDRTPVKHWNLRIEVFKDGYVPKYVSWSEPQGDAMTDVPAEYTTKLTPGVEIGGLVTSDTGRPITGASVVFSVSGQAPGAAHDRERVTMMGHYHTELTDTQGRWRCDHVPSQFSMITYQVLHPDYLTGNYGTAELGPTSAGGLTYLLEADLRSGSATFVLKTGSVITGVITDEQGVPIANAKVTKDHNWLEISATQVSGTNGQFVFRNVEPKDLTLTVQAADFAPQDVIVGASKPGQKLEIRLGRGGNLHGRVVDEVGLPVPHARISLTSDRFNRDRAQWRTQTDASGRFEWLHAPFPTETYTIEASGYSEGSAVELAADGSEHLITLRKANHVASFTVSGKAVDAETKLPIESFQVFMGTTEGGTTPSGGKHFVTSSPELKTKGRNGKFSFKVDGSALAYAFEARADGFWPALMTNVGPLTGDCQLQFRLKPGADIKGQVRLPDGTPAVGAVVLLCTETGRAYMKLPGQFDLTSSGNTGHAETDNEGRFSFKPQLDIELIRVAHKEGYAEVSLSELASSRFIWLRPWGRIEGRLRIGNRVGRNETIWLSNWHWRYGSVAGLALHMEAQTDSEGRFVFEGVPPGEREICHQVNLKPGKTGPEAEDRVLLRTGRSTSMILRPWFGQTQRTLVQVKAGETTEVKIGGSGCTVVGKVVASAIAQRIDWQRDVQNLTTKSCRAAEKTRAEFSSDSEYEAAQQAWSQQEREFWLSDTGRQLQLNSHQYVPLFGSDGSFRIEDVRPGVYQLTIRITDPSSADSSFVGKFLGSVEQEITVPELTESTTPALLDIGVLELQAQGQ